MGGSQGLIIDNFAGAGGASLGLERALGRPVSWAINHSESALEMHKLNHPHTKHLPEDVWKVDPVAVTKGEPVDLAWFSPDCTHFSRAKGSKPKSKRIRGLAWVAVRWAKLVRPAVIVVENVREFQEWGPLDEDGNPIPWKKGLTFKRWLGNLRGQGYAVSWKVLDAADYGAPTHRRRLFVIARCDSQPICWPEATHGPGRAHEWVPAATIIDWSIPCRSIFGRKKPLAEATMLRIANGVKRFVLEASEPFIVRTGHYSTRTGEGMRNFRGQRLHKPLGTVTSRCDYGLVVPHVTQYFGGMVGKPVTVPLPTVTAKDHNALVSAFLTKFYGTSQHGQSLFSPSPTVTATGTHIGQVECNLAVRTDRSSDVRAFLLKYYGTATGQSLFEPLHTVTSKARFGLVTVDGEQYEISDIGLRMLEPHELAAAQGLDGYKLTGTKAEQILRIGNSVPPALSEAIAAANQTRRSAAVA